MARGLNADAPVGCCHKYFTDVNRVSRQHNGMAMTVAPDNSDVGGRFVVHTLRATARGSG